MITISYFLPVTKAHVLASTVKATRKSTADGSAKARNSAVTVSTFAAADYRLPCTLEIPRQKWFNDELKLTFLADERLSSASLEATGHRYDGISASLKLAAAGVAAGAAFGPLGAVIGGAAGLLGSAAVEASATRTREALAPDLGAPADGPGNEAEELTRSAEIDAAGVDAGYADTNPAPALRLARLRRAEATATDRFLDVTAAPVDDTHGTRLADAAKALELLRAELGRAEAACQAWINADTVTTTTNFDIIVEVDELPTTSGAAEWLASTSLNPNPAQDLRDLCNAFGFVVTCDPDTTPPLSDDDLHLHWDPDQDPPRDDRDHSSDGNSGRGVLEQMAEREPSSTVRYRHLVPVLVRAFNFVRSDTGITLTPQSMERVLAASNGNEHGFDLVGEGQDAFSLAFDDTGALTSVGTTRTDPRVGAAAALGALPGDLQGAFDAGKDLTSPFTAAGRASALQGQVDEAKARAALAPAADPDQKLKDEVAKAELQARLAAARHLAGDPSATVVVIPVPSS